MAGVPTSSSRSSSASAFKPPGQPSSTAITVNIAPSGLNTPSTVAASRKSVAVGPVGQSGVLATAIPNAGALQPLLAALQGITNTQQQRQAQAVKLFNVNVKVINPEKKSNFETYVLRAVGPTNVFTVLQLKQQILKQFGPVIVPLALDYPVGYTKGGGSKVWIRTDADKRYMVISKCW